MQGWKWQLIVFGILCILTLPPVYRGYTKRISGDLVTREEVVGCWIQDNNSDISDLKEESALRSFAVFESDGKYYVGINCSIYSCSEAYTGNWYYSDQRNYFFRFIPWGYQAWLRLNSNHQAGPQFYFKKKNGNIQMYRGDYRAAIPETEFKMTKDFDRSSLKKLVTSGSE